MTTTNIELRDSNGNVSTIGTVDDQSKHFHKGGISADHVLKGKLHHTEVMFFTKEDVPLTTKANPGEGYEFTDSTGLTIIFSHEDEQKHITKKTLEKFPNIVFDIPAITTATPSPQQSVSS